MDIYRFIMGVLFFIYRNMAMAVSYKLGHYCAVVASFVGTI